MAALISCPACANRVSAQAASCPKCGHPLQEAAPAAASGIRAGAIPGMPVFIYSRGMEYKSKASIGGLPLVHIACGFDPKTGTKRIARGVIAIGDIAIGFFSLGGLSIGAIAIGGAAFGICALGGLAVAAYLAVGGGAIGYIALGGGALGYYAFGGGAFGAHTVSALSQDPQAVEFLKKTFGISFPSFGGQQIPWNDLQKFKFPGK